jgi:hypothetical protein
MHGQVMTMTEAPGSICVPQRTSHPFVARVPTEPLSALGAIQSEGAGY